MSIFSYFNIFPEMAETEIRTLELMGDDPDDDLSGSFAFDEYYCTDLDCDCRRVLIKVLQGGPEYSRPVEVATIAYTWDEEHFAKWLKHRKIPTVGLPSLGVNPYLDPLNKQGPNADWFLNMFDDMVSTDAPYVQRLIRHYDEIRKEIGHPGGADPSTLRKGSFRRSDPAEVRRDRTRRRRKLEQKRRR